MRWHYSANGSSGSWSGTEHATCGKAIEFHQQAMEDDLEVNPGTEIKAGCDFTQPGNNSSWSVSFTNAESQ